MTNIDLKKRLIDIVLKYDKNFFSGSDPVNNLIVDKVKDDLGKCNIEIENSEIKKELEVLRADFKLASTPASMPLGALSGLVVCFTILSVLPLTVAILTMVGIGATAVLLCMASTEHENKGEFNLVNYINNNDQINAQKEGVSTAAADNNLGDNGPIAGNPVGQKV
jgi:hypothetical protein